MDRWVGRVALVTGASSGIGAAVARDLVVHGLTVVGLARRKHRVKEIADELEDCRGKLYAVKADISKEDDIVAAFAWVEKSLGGVDILVNSASVTASASLVDGKSEDWKRIFDVNVFGPSICAREAVRSMKSRGVDDGYIININSVHESANGPRDSVYRASKLALTILTDGIRAEFLDLKSRIKVTSVTPGGIVNESSKGGVLDVLRRQTTLLEERHVAEMVTFILATPVNIQVSDMSLKPITTKPGYRSRVSK